MYKIYLKEPNPDNGFHEGWNTRYITDFAKSVRFYVRGNEFTRQLDYFVDCIKGNRFDNVSSFEEAHKTDVIMESIGQDAVRSLAMGGVEPMASPIFANPGRTTIWKKLSKLIGKR